MFDPKDREDKVTPESQNISADDPVERQKSKQPLSSRNKMRRNKAIKLQLQVISGFLVLAFVVGLIIPLRPKISEIENRTLTKFPKLTIDGLLDGSFFTELELWYADTYPMRELLLNLDGRFESLFGKNEEQIIGGNVTGDVIPDVTTPSSGFDWMQPPTPITTDPKPPTVDDPPAVDDPPEVDNPPTIDDPPNNDPDYEPEKHGSVYLLGDTAYELYGFSRKNTDAYIDIVNALAKRLNGSANIYPIIAPLSYGINLSETEQKKLGLTNQNDALVYIYSNLSDQVKKTYTYANLLAHKGEYLYFRTDHHWTALGAYYAYEVFCAQKGIAPTPLSSYKQQTYDGFIGTLYGSCGSPSVMKNNPDTVVAYKPTGTNSITCYQSNGEILKWNIITNVDNWKAGVKYNTFIGGDTPYSEIHNPNINDGSACVVVKNSYGNAFVPFLVDSYEYVYVIDFRYYDKWAENYYNGMTFNELISEKNVQDILIVTNIIATGSSGQINYMNKLFTK